MADIPEYPPTPSKRAIRTYLMSQKQYNGLLSDLNTCAGILTETRKPNGRFFYDAFEYPWHKLDYTVVTGLARVLSEMYKPATAARRLSAVKGVLRECWRQKLITSEDWMQIDCMKHIRVTSDQPEGRMLEEWEREALLAICDDGTKTGQRDTAMITLGLGCGLEASEVVRLTMADFSPATNMLTVLKSKNDKTRHVWVKNGTLAALHDWLRVRGNQPGPLFCRIWKGGRLDITDSLAAAAWGRIYSRRAEQAGVKDTTTHDLRRTFASLLFDAGVDIVVIKELMGHSSVATTAKYDRRPAERRQEAHSMINVLYGKKMVRHSG